MKKNPPQDENARIAIDADPGSCDEFATPPGDTIHYTEVVSNTGDASALNLQISHLINNANFVAGSLSISPLAGDDAFTAIGNTTLVVGGAAPATPAKVLAGNLFTNDAEFANDLSISDTLRC